MQVGGAGLEFGRADADFCHLQRHGRQQAFVSQAGDDLLLDFLVRGGVMLFADQQHISGQQRFQPGRSLDRCAAAGLLKDGQLGPASATR